MGMSKSGAETAKELKLSSLKTALHPSVLEEAMPRIAGPERLAETLTSRRHISSSPLDTGRGYRLRCSHKGQAISFCLPQSISSLVRVLPLLMQATTSRTSRHGHARSWPCLLCRSRSTPANGEPGRQWPRCKTHPPPEQLDSNIGCSSYPS